MRKGLTVISMLLLTVLPFLITCSKATSECLNEDLVVGQLVKKSEAFAAFYRSERPRIPQHICWVVNPNLPDKTPAVTVLSANKTYLKRIPPNADDDFIVAHELCTYILGAEGFPSTRATSEAYRLGVDYLSGSLNTMVATPLRDLILGRYGFDLEKQYEIYLGDFLTVPYEPVDLADKIRCMFFYAQMVLYWQDVLHRTEMSEFQQQFKIRYPDIAKDGDVLLQKIKVFGYDTPDKMAMLFADIISQWKLEPIVELVRQ